MSLSKIAVISLGGTISSTNKGGNRTGVESSMNADELISSIPQVSQFAEIEAIPFRMIGSTGLSFPDLFSLRDRIEELFLQGFDGAVVTQGTDTMEETSFFLNCVIKSDKPVVLTGAMRNPTLPSPDGPANLLASIQVAAAEQTMGLGTLVVMNDEIHHSKYVTKTHTSSLSTFRSFPLGPLGWVSEGKVRIALRPAAKRVIFDISPSSKEKEVAFYTVLTGDSGKLLTEISKLDYDGLVVEAAGGGHVVPVTIDTLTSIAQKIPVVLASRTRNGEILTKTYSFPGSEIDMIRRGLIPAGALNSLKARVLLYLLIRNGTSKQTIKRVFENWL